MKSVIFLVSLSLIFIVTNAVVDGFDKYRTVETKSGQIRGIRKTSMLKNTDFYSFRGIPYGKPPIGDLRFKAPESIEPWTSRFDAFEYGNTCVRPNQLFLIIDNYTQSEDCLFLNIFVPANAKPDDKLAVMFWIHGGGFSEWSGNDHLYGPDFLVEQNVILVTMNYRLGIFGFLSLGTPEYSGNMGLKDQQLALKWIHENIDQFYGDKNRITIFGESAGGSSVNYQMLSSESRMYFNNSIAMSGTTECIFTIGNENHIISLARKIAGDFKKPNVTEADLIKFYRDVEYKNIVNYGVIIGNHNHAEVNFVPIVEKTNAKLPFMVATPFEIYKTSDINTDVIFYHTSSEFLVFLDNLYPFIGNVWDINTNFSVDLPFRGFNYSFDSNEYRTLAKHVRQFYFGDAEIENKPQIREKYIDLMNDKTFVYPIHKSMKYHLDKSKGRTYYIQFSVNSTLNLMKRIFNNTAPGTSHVDETCYLFRSNACQQYYDEVLQNRDSNDSKVCLQTIDHITKLFTNFAKYGEPTHNNDPIAGYHPIQNDDIQLLDVSNEGLKVLKSPRKHALEFWTNLEEKAQQIMQNKAYKINSLLKLT